MCLRCCGTFLFGFFRCRYFVDMWVTEGHTQHDGPDCVCVCVCVVCASPRGVGVDRRRACPHRRDAGALAHSRCQWWCDPLGNNGPCELVCVNRGRPTHNGYPRGPGRVGVRGAIRWQSLKYVCRCGDRPLRPGGGGIGTAWRHTPVIHDDPDRRPNRTAFTLTGPSPISRCWFGKGTP